MLICGIIMHYARNKNKQTNLVILNDFLEKKQACVSTPKHNHHCSCKWLFKYISKTRIKQVSTCVCPSRVAHSHCWAPSGRPSGIKPVPDGCVDSSSVTSPNVRYTLHNFRPDFHLPTFFCRSQTKAPNLGLIVHMSVNYQRKKRRCQRNI